VTHSSTGSNAVSRSTIARLAAALAVLGQTNIVNLVPNPNSSISGSARVDNVWRRVHWRLGNCGSARARISEGRQGVSGSAFPDSNALTSR